MIECTICKSGVLDKELFCKNCGTQNKCLKCKGVLEIEAHFCTLCGETINENSKSNNKAINNIEFTQKGDSKSFKASFTDDVGVYFAGAFNNLVSSNTSHSRNPFSKIPQILNNKIPLSTGNSTQNKSEFQDIEILDLDYDNLLSKIFKLSETGKLEIIDNRLKEKSKLDKVKRLVILFVYAQKKMSTESVSRGDINEIVASEKLVDGNYRKFMAKAALEYISSKTPGYYMLLSAGEEFAQKILNEISDPNIVVSQLKSSRRSSKKSTQSSTAITSASNIKSSNGKNPSASQMCTTLINDKFFDGKRKLNDIALHCEQKKAVKYSMQNLNFALTRMIKDGFLEREKNSDNQYEYWKKQ